MTHNARAQLLTSELQPTAPQAFEAANAERLQAAHRLTHVGRYVLRNTLGENIHGGVYEAWDPLLSRTVAVRSWQFGLKMAARINIDRLLLSTGRQASELRHKHLVQVFDCGLSAHGVYVTMELLRGRDLRQARLEGWTPSLSEVLLLARRTADGLAALHAHKQAHCAIEPGNIFITRNGRPKLLNAFFASSLIHSQNTLMHGLGTGRPEYLSPEYWAAGHADASSDLYSLGLVMNELLTGQVTFQADSPEQLRRAIVTGRRSHLAETRPDLPREVVELVERLTSVERDRRPQSAVTLSQELRRLHIQFDGWMPRQQSAAPRAARGPRLQWPMRWSFVPSML